MGMNRCAYCQGSLKLAREGAQFCSAKCGTYFRRRTFPKLMTVRDRWVRHDTQKRPLDPRTGRYASVHDSATWGTYRVAKASAHGVGMGFVLSADDDICCIDLDGVLDNGVLLPEARKLIESVPDVFMVEISRSLEGVHVWHHGLNAPGTNRYEGGIRVERYAKERYLAVTGLRLGL